MARFRRSICFDRRDELVRSSCAATSAHPSARAPCTVADMLQQSDIFFLIVSMVVLFMTARKFLLEGLRAMRLAGCHDRTRRGSTDASLTMTDRRGSHEPSLGSRSRRERLQQACPYSTPGDGSEAKRFSGHFARMAVARSTASCALSDAAFPLDRRHLVTISISTVTALAADRDRRGSRNRPAFRARGRPRHADTSASRGMPSSPV